MRLIDAEAYEQTLIANGWDKNDDEFSTEGIFELLHDELTVKAILLDRIKEAREEIEIETRIEVKHYTNTDAVIDAVLEVLDELIAEKES